MLSVKMQYEGGARIEGVSFIKYEQLLGTKIDDISNKLIDVIFTKGKGGKEGEVLVNIDTYNELLTYLLTLKQKKYLK